MQKSLKSAVQPTWSRDDSVRAVGIYAMAAFGADVKVTLSGDQEVPAVEPAAGSGTIMIGDDKSVGGSVTTTGVAATMAHIHIAGAGKNGL